MAAPRKTTQPVNTESGDNTTPMTDEEKAQAIERFNLVAPSTTEEVTLSKEVGGHKSGATITVTPGAAEYLRQQGYVDSEGDDED
ncbi:hypothetical protein [Curtobacterium sp. Arg-1]|uniref:hypothetical protein n=1 Tax=Curtobacterium sp. Arg-1 TaxID=2935040 RepID=UPI0021D9FB24|nr:hypothetical protein [Curtobacterium sp. Arg-1]UXZ57078.1 hypothetical protein MXD64_13870 [Curtobacterium sp. Arg-1]